MERILTLLVAVFAGEHVLAVVVVVLEGGVAGGLRHADHGGGGAGDDRVPPHLGLHHGPARLHPLLLLAAGVVLALALDQRFMRIVRPLTGCPISRI